MEYYWKQEGWNLYVLVPPDGSEPIFFDSYSALYVYCDRLGIDAKQA